MYDRRLNGTVLSFGHAGILYRNSFVMYDRETESLWVHVTGRAEHGPRKGWQVEFMPSTVTTWAEWKRAHPHTLVLPGYRRGGFMGTYTGVRSPAGIGLSVLVNFKAKLYPFKVLSTTPVVNDTFNGEDVVVAYSPQAGTAGAWRRRLDDRSLTFEAGPDAGEGGDFLLRDRETGSHWSWMTGTAVSGELEGRQLGYLPHHPILNKRFRGFYPDGPILQ